MKIIEDVDDDQDVENQLYKPQGYQGEDATSAKERVPPG